MSDTKTADRPVGTWDGGCLCGAVRFRAKRPDRRVIACHCRQCRQMSGHYFAATAAAWPDVEILVAEGLRWYGSSATSRRGFCRDCGASLFFDHGPDEPVGIAAGAFDEEPPFKLAVHIWTDEAGGYYELADDLPKYTAEDWRKRQGWRTYRGPSAGSQIG